MKIDLEHNLSHCAIDFECYYDGDVSIKKLGAYAYLHHPLCDVYVVTITDPASGHEFTGRPEDFDWRSLDGRFLVSHNNAFDKMVADTLVEKGLIESFDYAEWQCTANLAAYLRVGRSLKAAVKNLYGQEVSKDYRDLAKGRQWQDMVDAGVYDQVVESNVVDARWCWQIWQDHGHVWVPRERKLSAMTTEQCHRGIPININMVMDGIQTLEEQMKISSESVPWKCSPTEGVVSTNGLKAACEQAGIPMPSSTAEDSAECKAWEEKFGGQFPWISHMRNWRKCNTLKKRLEVMRDRVDERNVMTYAQKYFGAHTGRWTGGGADGGTGEKGFSTQTNQKNALHGVDARKCQIASPGRKLIIADAAQIEPRCLAWMSQDHEKMELIRGGMSVYEVHARQTMGWVGGVMKKEDPKLYRLAKDRVLGLGFGCGHVKFRNYTLMQSGIELTAIEARRQVKEFRAKEKKIIGVWNMLHAEFADSVMNPTLVHLGVNYDVPAYVIELPSGRELTYFYPQIKRRSEVFAKAGGKGKKVKDAPQQDSNAAKKRTAPQPHQKDEDEFDARDYKLEYCAKNQLDGKFTFYYGGLLTENATQALARDVFGEMMIRVEEEYGDYARILFHSHDEVILDADPGISAKEIEECMGMTPDWMPGCPFAAEAEESDYYKK